MCKKSVVRIIIQIINCCVLRSIIYKLLIDIRPQIGDLYVLCDDVALLDMLVSIAQSSSNAGFVKPRFSSSYTHVEGLRHPMLEYSCDSELITNAVVRT